MHPHYAAAPASDPAVISRLGRAADIFEWRLTLTLDPFGNRIEYLYDSDAGEGEGHEWKQPLLAQICYGDYGDRANPSFMVTATSRFAPVGVAARSSSKRKRIVCAPRLHL